MLFNLQHPDVMRLNKTVVNDSTGSFLHKFRWTTKENVGGLPPEWNYVPDITSKSIEPKAIHYTKGGPWFEEYRNCPYSDIWIEYMHKMPKNFLTNNLLDQ
jgi:hypothetical protein